LLNFKTRFEIFNTTTLMVRQLWILRLTDLCPGLPGWASTRKVKPIWFYRSKRQWVAVVSITHS